jgi:hypothetical protein
MMYLKNSQIGQFLLTAVERSRNISQSSSVVNLSRAMAAQIGTYVRGSYCFRWLMKEMEPRATVGKLRATRTIGPMMGLLERVAVPVKRAWETSRTAAIVLRTTDREISEYWR